MRKNVVLIGVGNIGRRYLQSMFIMDYDWEIFAVEKNSERIDLLKKEFPKVKFCKDLSSVPRIIDLCAIATTSDVRRSVTEEVLDTKDVKYMVLEKVLFQKEKDYEDIKKLLENKCVKAWVNHTDRETVGYKWLKNKMDDIKQFTVHVSGCSWGLCCNALHYLDKIKYLTGSDELTINFDDITGPIEESKRKGFYEIYGSISGECGICTHYEISCIQGDRSVPVTVTVTCDNGVYVINESNCVLNYSCKDEGFLWKSMEFPLEYTSQIMGRIFKDILETGNCKLPDYKSSMNTHILFINGIREFMNAKGFRTDVCPIT